MVFSGSALVKPASAWCSSAKTSKTFWSSPHTTFSWWAFKSLTVGGPWTTTSGSSSGKRLERHSRKAMAPILLFGYFRDVLKLGHGDSLSLDKIIEESKLRVKDAGKAHQVIPRFCDFVTGSSTQLADIFFDVNKLYRYPGFVLQQCAYNNSLFHFTKLIENPNLTKDDLCYNDDELADNPIMIAAKLRHKDLVSSILRSNRFQNTDNNEFLADLIHTKNQSGQTLLAMVALQGNFFDQIKKWQNHSVYSPCSCLHCRFCCRPRTGGAETAHSPEGDSNSLRLWHHSCRWSVEIDAVFKKST